MKAVLADTEAVVLCMMGRAKGTAFLQGIAAKHEHANWGLEPNSPFRLRQLWVQSLSVRKDGSRTNHMIRGSLRCFNLPWMSQWNVAVFNGESSTDKNRLLHFLKAALRSKHSLPFSGVCHAEWKRWSRCLALLFTAFVSLFSQKSLTQMRPLVKAGASDRE